MTEASELKRLAMGTSGKTRELEEPVGFLIGLFSRWMGGGTCGLARSVYLAVALSGCTQSLADCKAKCRETFVVEYRPGAPDNQPMVYGYCRCGLYSELPIQGKGGP